MGAERRPRGHRRRRDTAVKAHRSFPPPSGGVRHEVSNATLTGGWSVEIGWGTALSARRKTCPPPDRARSSIRARSSSPARGRKTPVPPSQTRALRERTLHVALILRDRREAAIVSKHEGVRATLSTRARTLATTATHLSRPRSRTLIESKSTSSSCSTTAKCVATRSQRVDEMHACDSGLHRTPRPLSRAPNSLRGRRIRVSRRASQP